MYVTVTQAARRLTAQTGFEVSANVINAIRIKTDKQHEEKPHKPRLFYKGRHRGEYFKRFHCNWFELLDFMKQDINYKHYLEPRVKKVSTRPKHWTPEPPPPPIRIEGERLCDGDLYEYRTFLQEHYGSSDVR